MFPSLPSSSLSHHPLSPAAPENADASNQANSASGASRPIPPELILEVGKHIPTNALESLQNLRLASRAGAAAVPKAKLYAANQIRMIRETNAARMSISQKIAGYRNVFELMNKLRSNESKADVLIALIPAMFNMRATRQNEQNLRRNFLLNTCTQILDAAVSLGNRDKAQVLRLLGKHAAISRNDTLFDRINTMSNTLGDEKWIVQAGLVESFSASFPSNKEARFNALLAEATTSPVTHGKAIFLTSAAMKLTIASANSENQRENFVKILNAAADLSNTAKINILSVLSRLVTIDPSGGLFDSVTAMSDTLGEEKWNVQAGLIESFSASFPPDKEAKFDALFTEAVTPPVHHGKAVFLASSATRLIVINNDQNKRAEILLGILGAAENFSGADRAAILLNILSGINLLGLTRGQAEEVINTVLAHADAVASADRLKIYLAVMNAQIPLTDKPQRLLALEQQTRQMGGLMLPEHQTAMFEHRASSMLFQYNGVRQKIDFLDPADKAALLTKFLPTWLENLPVGERFRSLRNTLSENTSGISSEDMEKVLESVINSLKMFPENRCVAALEEIVEKTHALEVPEKSRILERLARAVVSLPATHHDEALACIRFATDTLPDDMRTKVQEELSRSESTSREIKAGRVQIF